MSLKRTSQRRMVVMAIIRPSSIVRQIFLLTDPPICQEDSSLPWWCTTTRMPDGIGTVDNLISVVDRDDTSVSRYLSDSSYRLDPHVQIIVRAVGLGTCYDKMREVTDRLDTLYRESVVIDADTYIVEHARRTTNVQLRGLDATGRRYLYTIEYDLHFL